MSGESVLSLPWEKLELKSYGLRGPNQLGIGLVPSMLLAGGEPQGYFLCLNMFALAC